jgi:uncharacterized membrane protein YdbT with pleckstrin-like domain
VIPESAKAAVLRLLRVPAEPRVPADGRVIRVFRAAPSYFRYRLLLWVLKQIGAIAGLIVGLLLISAAMREIGHPVVVRFLQGAEVLAWLTFFTQIPFSLVVLKLDYELRWYILSDRSLRIREGTLSVREKTMTFANIQQISIEQNPVQRLLGIADVHVRTAGGGSGGSDGKNGTGGEGMHEAYFRGVDNAEEIRTAIRERVRLHRDAGLGDPDEPESLPSGTPETLDSAVAALQNATRDLRRSLVRGAVS